MSQQTLIKAAGLHTFKNYLSSVPEGALEEALNIVIDRDNIIELRRGFYQFGDTFGVTSDRLNQIFSYKNRILRHYDSTLQFDSNGSGSFTTFTGSYNEIVPGSRIKSLESNGNFYFTTDKGIKKISALVASDITAASIAEAGAPKALDAVANTNYSQEGFLVPFGKCAYRIVWGYTDLNSNLILGAPSERVVVQNLDAGTSCIVDLTFSVPEDITSTNYFYQIYRTAVFEATIGDLDALDLLNPGDEMYLVYEDFITSPIPTSVTVQDITPEDFREGGTLLYTNPVSGDGIEQSNEKPPFANDICLFNERVFLANTKTKHRMNLSLLSVLDLQNLVSKITITNGLTSNEYTFRGFIETYTVDFSGMTFPGGKAALDGKYFTLASSNDDRVYKIWFDNTGTTTEPTVAGTISIPVDITAIADTATAIAVETMNVINAATNDFNIVESLGVLTVETSNNGYVDTVVSENIGASFSITQDGLGYGEDTATQKVLLPKVPMVDENGPSIGQQVDQAARSLVRVINANPSEIVYAYYFSSDTDVPGQIFLESRETVSEEFFITCNDKATTGDEFNPSLPEEVACTIATGTGTVTITSAAHGLSNGTEIILYDTTTTPNIGNAYIISNVTLNTFDISTDVSVAGSGNYSLATVYSTNEVSPNRIYYSKYQQPDAVPLVNYLDIGPKDKKILRIVPLKSSLFIFKEEGIYRLSGDAPFVVTPFDDSVILTAPDTASVLNGQIYCLSTQGVISVSEGGVSVVSRPIEDKFLQISRPGFAYKTASFGVSYESERSYHLWTVTNVNDTVATQCFRFNTFTQTWVRWDKSATCGLVNFADNKMYLGAGDLNLVDIERKNLDRTDKCDRQYDLQIAANGVNNEVLNVSSIANTEIGDMIQQIQYLTISEFNRLLKQLDLDPTVVDIDYFSSLEVSPGDNLRNKVNDLALKLDLDSGVSDTNYFSSLVGTNTFSVIQSDFNIIINKLNNDSGVHFSNYTTSTGTKKFEGIIVDTEVIDNKITLTYFSPFIEGPITSYRAIQSQVTWTYQALGDPSIFKQVNQGTLIFEDNNFTTAQIAYSSDLSPGFSEVAFNGYGNGDWGQFNWGNQFWGGLSSAKPLRTLVPRQKQRCRYMGIRFTHSNAQENYAIYGLSLTFRPYSDKAYPK